MLIALWLLPLDFISQVLWAANILALKISVLCLYLRLFPNQTFIITCSGVLGVMMVGGLTFLLLDVLQCQPVSAGWTLQHGDDAKCLSFSVIAMGGGAFNVLSEVAIFVLPMPILLKLQVRLKQKLEIIILLGLGVM